MLSSFVLKLVSENDDFFKFDGNDYKKLLNTIVTSDEFRVSQLKSEKDLLLRVVCFNSKSFEELSMEIFKKKLLKLYFIQKMLLPL